MSLSRSRIILAIMALFLTACSTVPEVDREPPHLEIQLSTWYFDSSCPMSVVFAVSPALCSDNASSLEECRIRYDFDDDGQWDTEFEEPVLREWNPGFHLPEGQWTVRCELKDAMGNRTSGTETLDMPGWTPTAPDILNGDITFDGYEVMDPHPVLRAGEQVWIFLKAQDWVHDENLVIHQEYYLDDVLIGEQDRSPRFCPSHLCCMSLLILDEGFTEVGMHELRIEVTLPEETPDTDPSNNFPSTVFEVIAPE